MKQEVFCSLLLFITYYTDIWLYQIATFHVVNVLQHTEYYTVKHARN